MNKFYLLLIASFAVANIPSAQATKPASETAKERKHRTFDVAVGMGYGQVGLPGGFGQFCGNYGNYMNQMGCGGGGCFAPPPPSCNGACFPQPRPMPRPMPPPIARPMPQPFPGGCGASLPCGGPPPMPFPGGGCMNGGCVSQGGYMNSGIMNQGGFVGGGYFGMGEMSPEAQIVWGAAAGFSSLATFIEPRAFPSRYQSVTIMDPYYLGPRVTEHTPRPIQ